MTKKSYVLLKVPVNFDISSLDDVTFDIKSLETNLNDYSVSEETSTNNLRVLKQSANEVDTYKSGIFWLNIII